jgi:hypothetical protein
MDGWVGEIDDYEFQQGRKGKVFFLLNYTGG